MHPILDDRRRLALYLLAWIFMGVLLTVGLRADRSWLTATAFFLPLCVVYAFVGLSAWYVCRALPIEAGTTATSVLVIQVTASLSASGIWVALGSVWAAALDSFTSDFGAESLFAEQRLLLFVVGALLFGLASACHYLIIAAQASREAETRAIELSLLAREAELKALRAQIDPHFIFNSLHSISALTATDAAAARRMCLLLAEFLRETLRLGASQRISLAEELALTERFLAIEQVRLGTRLQIASETDPRASECLVPPLLLQPLVENAVVHGVAQLIEGGTIRLIAQREGSTLTITLENPCDPDRPRTRGVGLGLDLLRRRLTTQFGAYDAIHANEESGCFRVRVRIPAVTVA
jgi:two-component system, LytTR family, sensor histidine kinase AlgZ